MFKGRERLKEVVLNDGLTKIGGKSFHGCYQLEHINLPSTVTEIGGISYDFSRGSTKRGDSQWIGSLAFAHCIKILGKS